MNQACSLSKVRRWSVLLTFEKLMSWELVSSSGHTGKYSAGLKLAIERGWLVMHESSTYVKFTQAGAELFA